MTAKERIDFLNLIKQKQEEFANDKKAAIQFLKDVGIITKKTEKLAKPYKNLCIPEDRG